MNGFRKNWQFCVLNNALLDMLLQHLEQKCKLAHGEHVGDAHSSLSSIFENANSDYKIYKNEFMARRSFLSGVPLSVVELELYGFCIVMKHKLLIHVKFSTISDAIPVNGLSYFHFLLDDTTSEASGNEVILGSILLLPKLVDGTHCPQLPGT